MNNNSNFNLPWGVYVGDGYFVEENYIAKTEVKCECGTTITLGKEDSPELHQDYCPIFKEYKAKDIK